MAHFKGLKHRWLQQFQEQQEHQLEKVRSSSSTFGGESTQHQQHQPQHGHDAASRPGATAQQAGQQQRRGGEQWARDSTSQAAAAGPDKGAPRKPALASGAARGAAGGEAPPQGVLGKQRREQREVGDPPDARPAQRPVPPNRLPNSGGGRQGGAAELPAAAAARPEGGGKASRREAAAPDGRQQQPPQQQPVQPLTQQQQQQQGGFSKPRPKGESGVVTVKNEVASAGSNPSTSAHKDEREGHEEAASAQQQVKQEAGPSAVVPVEVEARPSAKAQHLGELLVEPHGSFEELVAALQANFGDKLPKKTGMRVVYQDHDGDWLLLLPDGPWHLFCSSVRRLLVTYK